MAFLVNSQAQVVSGKNEYYTQTPWRGAQCSCIGLRPALVDISYWSLSAKTLDLLCKLPEITQAKCFHSHIFLRIWVVLS